MNEPLQDRIAELSPQQLKQLASRLSLKRTVSPGGRELGGRRRKGEPLPLSYAQERLWLIEQMGLVGSAYHMSIALRVDGALDEPALELSLGELVRRHESLRTRFEQVDGQPQQRIDEATSFTLHRPGTAEFAQGLEAQRLEAFARSEFQRPFDLVRGPLFRASLLQVGERRHGLVLSMHHIISDGWSNGVLIRELRALYEAYAGGRSSPLAEPRWQYADYALWQRQVFAGEARDRQLSYWKEQLAGAPEVLELPTDRPRPLLPSHRGGAHAFALPPSLSEALARLARREDATMFMLLLAALQLLLSRWSGQQDVLVGTSTAGRSHPQTEGMIGFFVNALALRGRLDEVDSFVSLLHQARDTALAAYAHQDVPFDMLVKALAPTRDLSRQPIFQVLLEWRGGGGEAFALGDLQLEQIDGGHATAKFDISLTMEDSPQGLQGVLQYATDLFDPSTMARFAAQLVGLLEAVAAAPEASLRQLDLLGGDERRQLLLEWNDTAVDYSDSSCVHELIAEQARRTPDAIAVVYQNSSLSYAQLEGRANQLAWQLGALGIGAESIVALCLPRSLELVIGLLGILKAGAAYLPVDPGYPVERVRFMLEDAAVPAIVGGAAELEAVLGGHAPDGVALVRLDLDAALIQAWPTTAPNVTLDPANMAYFIYTSGSTGRPKGVMNSHQGLANRLHWMQHAYALGPHDRVLQKTPFTFDVSVWEFLWPLMCGARLVMAQPEGHKDPYYLIELIRAAGITTLHFVPSMLEAFLATPGAESCDSIVRVICSGEALPDPLRARFFKTLAAELHNLYGPTEAAIDVTYWPCERSDLRGHVPIGRPLANIRVYVLDRDLRPVTIGASGDLYLAGVGLARGYRGRAGLTATRFVADPFGQGGRLYRTGDLARWRADGTLEYLGRSDQQVKLRGLRIELGEIEACLGQHPSVAQAAVMLREDRPGQRQLVGYVVPVPGQSFDPAVLRAALAERLPDYMLPAAILSLPSIPLSANGKLDRRALPVPDFIQVDGRDPASEEEAILARLFADLLGREQVGIDDSFFDLGGDSIVSIRLVSEARKAGLHISPRDVFRHQSVSALATVAARVIPVATAGDLPEVNVEPACTNTSALAPDALPAAWLPRPAGGGRRLPLTPVQRIHLALWGDEISLNVSTSLYVLEQRIEPAALGQAIDILLRRHDALRLIVERRPEGWSQRLSAVPAELERVLRLVQLPAGGAETIDAAIAAEMALLGQGLDLARGHLLRVSLLESADGSPQRLALAVHHFANDVLSFPFLIEELQWLCLHGVTSGTAAPSMAPPGMPFADWAEAVDDYVRSHGEGLAWTEREVTPCALPRDYPDGDNLVASIRVWSDAVPGVNARLVQQLARRLAVSVDDLLSMVFAQSLHGWLGPSRLSIEKLIHGREPLGASGDLSRSIGWFTSGVPLTFEFADSGEIECLAAQVHAQAERDDAGGLAYWMHAARRIAQGLDPPSCEICLNHQGERGSGKPLASVFRRVGAPEHGVLGWASQARRRNVLELQTAFVDGDLHTAWFYSANLHDEASIRDVASRFRATLQQVVNRTLIRIENGTEREYL